VSEPLQGTRSLDGQVEETGSIPTLALPHKCKPVARVDPALMDFGRDWWLGELVEPLPEWPKEKYCMHLKTPIKDVTFFFTRGDLELLTAMMAAVIGIVNPVWLERVSASMKRPEVLEWK